MKKQKKTIKEFKPGDWVHWVKKIDDVNIKSLFCVCQAKYMGFSPQNKTDYIIVSEIGQIFNVPKSRVFRHMDFLKAVKLRDKLNKELGR